VAGCGSPAASRPAGSRSVSATALWAGGDHNVALGILMYLPGSTLTADGEPLIVRGVLELPPDVK
jgi:aminopeptidase